MISDNDKPLTPAQARQKLQQGLKDYLAGNDTGPIVFRLKRTKKASHTYPLKLTQQQRETLLEHTHLSGKLKKKIELVGEGTQIVPVTRNELHKLNDETGQAAVYARSPHKKRLMAVMGRVVKFFEEEHAEYFPPKPHLPPRVVRPRATCYSRSRSRCWASNRRSGGGFSSKAVRSTSCTNTFRRRWAG